MKLYSNQINDEGARHLADALQQNQVLYQPFILECTHYFIQTLTTLDLWYNDIGKHGARYLANALQQNQVIFSAFHSIIQLLFRIDTHHTETRWQYNG